MDNPNKPPEKTAGDHVHAATRIVLSAIPYFGGPANNLFAAILAPPLDARRNRWLESIADRLQALEQINPEFKIDSLKDNPRFISGLLEASQAALRTHQEIKLEALRNAVINIADGVAPNDDLQEFFLRLVDNLTALHIQVLELFVHRRHGRIEQFPYLQNFELACQVAIDLEARGLIQHLQLTFDSPSAGYGTIAKIDVKERQYIWRTHGGDVGVEVPATDLGKQFFNFITRDRHHPG